MRAKHKHFLLTNCFSSRNDNYLTTLLTSRLHCQPLTHMGLFCLANLYKQLDWVSNIFPLFRSCGSEEDFYCGEKSRNLGGHHPPFRRQGSFQTNSMDRMSVSSGDSSTTTHSTYDHPKTVLKVTSSPLALKRNGSSVSAMSGPPVSPLRRTESLASSGSGCGEMRRMVSATPCGCGDSVAGSVGGYENYDIPRNLGRQVSATHYQMSQFISLIFSSAQTFFLAALCCVAV